MLKKLFVTAATAAAMTVPLAGAAWATPADNNPPGHPEQGSTGPGMPHEFGSFADSVNLNPNGPGNPIPPGQEINIAKTQYPGVPTPTAVGNFVNDVYASQNVTTAFGPTPPGLAVKTFGPGCAHGHTADSNSAVIGSNICN